MIPYGWQCVNGVNAPVKGEVLSVDAPASFSSYRLPVPWDLMGVYQATDDLEHPLVGDVSAGPVFTVAGSKVSGSAPNVPNIGRCPTGFRGRIDGLALDFLDHFGRVMAATAGMGRLENSQPLQYILSHYTFRLYVNNQQTQSPRLLTTHGWGVVSPEPVLWLSSNDSFIVTVQRTPLLITETDGASYDGVNIIDPVYAVMCRVRGQWVPDDKH